jgi:putative transposase
VYVSPHITRDLQDRGIRVGFIRVVRIMREVGIIGRTKRRYRVHTTDSNHDQPITPNLLSDIPLP